MISSGASQSDDRARLRTVLEQPLIQRSILGLIIINALVLGLETSDELMTLYGPLLLSLDAAILFIFVIEIIARIFVYRGAFFRDPWSLFDLTVVAIALVPASGPLAVLRAFRVLRVLRALTLLPSMRRVVGGLLASIPGISSIALVMGIIFYVFAVLAATLFGDDFPEWFGSVGNSLYTLFQVMTLESWSMGIARPVMETHPYAWLFFIPFILIATFNILNLFIAITINTMQTMHDRTHTQEKAASEDALHNEGSNLGEQLQKLREELLNGEILYSLAEARIGIEGWRQHYNAVRPHASLGYRPPAPEVFVPVSPRGRLRSWGRLRGPRSVWRQDQL